MRQQFYSDNARPCWSCNGTIAEYTVDDTISLIDVVCIACRRRDVFRPTKPPADHVAAVSAAHRDALICGCRRDGTVMCHDHQVRR
jgi:hypothetical protein